MVELRRRPSMTSPSKATIATVAANNPYAQTARRSSRQASQTGINYSDSTSGSSSSPVGSRHSQQQAEPTPNGTRRRHVTTSPEQHRGERASKRRRVSMGDGTVSNRTPSSQVSATSSDGSRRSARLDNGHTSILLEDAAGSPVAKRRSRRLTQSTYDEIIVRTEDAVEAKSAFAGSPDASLDAEQGQDSDNPLDSKPNPIDPESSSHADSSQANVRAEHAETAAPTTPLSDRNSSATTKEAIDATVVSREPSDTAEGAHIPIASQNTEEPSADMDMDAMDVEKNEAQEAEEVSANSAKDEDDNASLTESVMEDAIDSRPNVVPRLITTTASPLEPISEEDNEAPQTPMSVTAGEPMPAEAGKPTRKLPGRRRAPHANPKVEAALRRQLQLRIRYRAVAKHLKPVLVELSKRNIKILKTDEDAHINAIEHTTVTKELGARVEARLGQLEVQHKYQKDLLDLSFAAETESQHMRYRQRIRNVRADMMNRLKHDFLIALRRHQAAGDEHASEDEGDDVVPSLHHINVHGRRTHILPSKYDSRSRKLIEVDRLFDELTEKELVAEAEQTQDIDHVKLKPTPFTYLDYTHREAVQHDRNLAALIHVLRDVTREEPKLDFKPEVKPESEGAPVAPQDPSRATSNLQVLASASVTNTQASSKAPSVPSKHSMAALLNAEDQPIQSRTSVQAVPVTGGHLVERQQGERHTPSLLPAFVDGRYSAAQYPHPHAPTNGTPMAPPSQVRQAAAPTAPFVAPVPMYAATPDKRDMAASDGSYPLHNRSTAGNQPTAHATTASAPTPSWHDSGPVGRPIDRPGLVPLPAEANARHRSASDVHARQADNASALRPFDPARPMDAGVNFHDAYNSSRNDPFTRRSTISSATERQYPPQQSSVPSYLQQQQRSPAVTRSPLTVSALTANTTMHDRFPRHVGHEALSSVPTSTGPASQRYSPSLSSSSAPTRHRQQPQQQKPPPLFPPAGLPPPPLPPAEASPIARHQSYSSYSATNKHSYGSPTGTNAAYPSLSYNRPPSAQPPVQSPRAPHMAQHHTISQQPQPSISAGNSSARPPPPTGNTSTLDRRGANYLGFGHDDPMKVVRKAHERQADIERWSRWQTPWAADRGPAAAQNEQGRAEALDPGGRERGSGSHSHSHGQEQGRGQSQGPGQGAAHKPMSGRPYYQGR